MFSKTPNYAVFFNDENAKNTDKVFYGRVSEAFNTGKKDEKGKSIFEYDTWNVRFCGKARKKVEGLADKTRITLTEWSARVYYNKDKDKVCPYLMVTDFELREASSKSSEVNENSGNAEMVEIAADDNLPF